MSGRGAVSYIFGCASKRNANYIVFADEVATTALGFFGQLPYEEDFSLLLLRIGTASLEATGLRGWNNEVAPIPLPVRSRDRNRARGKSSRGDRLLSQTYGAVRMGRIGVAEVQYGSTRLASSFSSNPYEDLSIRPIRRTKSSGTQQRQQQGLFNEVRTIELGVTNASQPPHGFTGWWRRIIQTWPFFVALWDVLKGLVLFLWDRARSRGRSQQGDRVKKASTTIRKSPERHWQEEDYQGLEDDDDGTDDKRRMDSEKEVYSRFLRGEEISDDDDDFSSSFGDEDSREDVEDDDEEEEEGEENDQGEAVRLYSDFLRNGRGTSTCSLGGGGGEMILAHFLHGQATSSGPLTRKGWNELVGKEGVRGRVNSRSHFVDDEDEIWNQHVFNRSDDSEATSADSLNTTSCVICTNAQRDVICWPCRYVT